MANKSSRSVATKKPATMKRPVSHMGILKRKHQPDKAETKKKARAEEKTAEESEEEKLEEEEQEEIEEASSAKPCKLTKKALSDHDTFICRSHGRQAHLQTV